MVNTGRPWVGPFQFFGNRLTANLAAIFIALENVSDGIWLVTIIADQGATFMASISYSQKSLLRGVSDMVKQFFTSLAFWPAVVSIPPLPFLFPFLWRSHPRRVVLALPLLPLRLISLLSPLSLQEFFATIFCSNSIFPCKLPKFCTMLRACYLMSSHYKLGAALTALRSAPLCSKFVHEPFIVPAAIWLSFEATF